VFVDAQLCAHQEGQTHAVMKRHVCLHISHITVLLWVCYKHAWSCFVWFYCAWDCRITLRVTHLRSILRRCLC